MASHDNIREFDGSLDEVTDYTLTVTQDDSSHYTATFQVPGGSQTIPNLLLTENRIQNTTRPMPVSGANLLDFIMLSDGVNRAFVHVAQETYDSDDISFGVASWTDHTGDVPAADWAGSWNLDTYADPNLRNYLDGFDHETFVLEIQLLDAEHIRIALPSGGMLPLRVSGNTAYLESQPLVVGTTRFHNFHLQGDGLTLSVQSVASEIDDLTDVSVTIGLGVKVDGPPYLWRDAVSGPDGWLNLDWFGWFQDTGSVWIYHAEHGWLYAGGTTTANLWLYDAALDCWWWTSNTAYPFLYKTGANSGWYWYQRAGAPGARWFYRYGNGDWVQEADMVGGPAPAGFALIPAGSFQMGDALADGYSYELPVHTVHVSAFYMQTTEVTKAQWDDVADWASTHGYDITQAGGSGKAANHPAYSVDWYECVKYANAKSEREGLTPVYTVSGSVMRTGTSTPTINYAANGYRLPTEAEWEKAARGGISGRRFPWGDTITHSQGNYYSSTSFAYDVSPTRGQHPTYNDGVSPYTSPVGTFAPNGYGLYDMAGNLWEWCGDRYSNSYYGNSPGSDPTGPTSGSLRVLRGGYWSGYARFCRVSDRNYYFPGDGSRDIGFRLARSSGG